MRITLLLLLALVAGVAQANPPYITSGANSPEEFLVKIGPNASAFTGGTVSIQDIRNANRPGAWKVAPIGPGHETARVTNREPNWWRNPSPSEMAVWIVKVVRRGMFVDQSQHQFLGDISCQEECY
jgi:hypothetical protein